MRTVARCARTTGMQTVGAAVLVGLRVGKCDVSDLSLQSPDWGINHTESASLRFETVLNDTSRFDVTYAMYSSCNDSGSLVFITEAAITSS